MAYLLSFKDKDRVPFAECKQIIATYDDSGYKFMQISHKIVDQDYTIQEMYTIAIQMAQTIEYEELEFDKYSEKLLILMKTNQIKSQMDNLEEHLDSRISEKKMNWLSILFKFIKIGLQDPVIPELFQFYSLMLFDLDRSVIDHYEALRNPKFVTLGKCYTEGISPDLSKNKATILITFHASNGQAHYINVQAAQTGTSNEKLMKTTIKKILDLKHLKHCIHNEEQLQNTNISQILEIIYHFQLNSYLWMVRVDQIEGLDKLKISYLNDNDMSKITNFAEYLLVSPKIRIESILFSDILSQNLGSKTEFLLIKSFIRVWMGLNKRFKRKKSTI